MTLAQILSVAPMERRAWTSPVGPACTPAQAEAKLRDGQALMRSLWASLFLAAELGPEYEHKYASAHAGCLNEHTCGTYTNFTSFMQGERAQAKAHQLGVAGINYEPRPCEFKNDLPFYCASSPCHPMCGVAPKEFFLVTP